MAPIAGPGGTAGSTPYAGLAAGVNEFMIGQVQAPFIAGTPGYLGNMAQWGQNIGAGLKGQLNQDVINQVIQQAAQRGIATGNPYNIGAPILAATAQTSQGVQAQAAKQFQEQIAATPVPELWNPMSLYVPERLGAQSLAAARAGMGSGGGGGGGFGAMGGGRVVEQSTPWAFPGASFPGPVGTGNQVADFAAGQKRAAEMNAASQAAIQARMASLQSWLATANQPGGMLYQPPNPPSGGYKPGPWG